MNADSKHVLVLVGPKGAGKSRLGALVERAFGLAFLPVERLWIEHGKLPRDEGWEQAGWQRVVAAAHEALRESDTVVLETTGAAPWTEAFLEALGTFARVHLVRVQATPERCLARVRARDPRDHIPIDEARVAEINRAASAIDLPFRATLSNDTDWYEPRVRASLRSLLRELGLATRALTPVLRTSRLVLRGWRSDDLEAFAAMNADPQVMRHYPAVLSRAESDALMARISDHLDEHGFGVWAVEVPGVAPFVGFVGLAVPRFEAAFTPCVELGWRLGPAYWGRGYASEGARAATELAFDSLDLDELYAWTVPANLPSERVMRAIGMRRSPADDFEHPLLPEGHPLRPHIVYRLSREDWRARRSAAAP